MGEANKQTNKQTNKKQRKKKQNIIQRAMISVKFEFRQKKTTQDTSQTICLLKGEGRALD